MSNIQDNNSLFLNTQFTSNTVNTLSLQHDAPIISSTYYIDKVDMPLLISMMSAESENIWETALTLLCRLGRVAVPVLIKALNDESEQTRMLAANALGYIGDVEAIAPLMKILHDSSSEVREAAREALRRLVIIFMRPAQMLDAFMSEVVATGPVAGSAAL